MLQPLPVDGWEGFAHLGDWRLTEAKPDTHSASGSRAWPEPDAPHGRPAGMGSVCYIASEPRGVSWVAEGWEPVGYGQASRAQFEVGAYVEGTSIQCYHLKNVGFQIDPTGLRLALGIATETTSGVERLYHMEHKVEVRRFLRKHPQVLAVLLEAYPHLQKHFGASPDVLLEVVADAEAEQSEMLFAYVLTALPAKQALERLDQFDEDWFLDQLDRVGDLFCFNL